MLMNVSLFPHKELNFILYLKYILNIGLLKYISQLKYFDFMTLI